MTATKLRFGLDVDGVLYNFDWTARRLITQHFENIDMPPFSHEWGSIKDEAGAEAWRWLWSADGGLRMLFTEGDPYPGAVEAAQEIAKLADIVIITSVPGAAVYDRVDWLARQRVPCSELHVTTQPKHLIKPYCDIYIDDGPHNVQDLRNHTSATVLVWDRPYNQDVHTDAQVIRVREWGEVLDKVRRLMCS